RRLPVRYKAWRGGAHMTALATYYRLYRDRAFVDRQAAGLATILRRLERSQVRSGPKRGRLTPEQLSSDQPRPVDGVTAQLAVVQGLKAMAPIWRATGHRALSIRATIIRRRLEAAMRRGVRASLVRLPDGSLFLPQSLGRRSAPYRNLSVSSEGSYWN